MNTKPPLQAQIALSIGVAIAILIFKLGPATAGSNSAKVAYGKSADVILAKQLWTALLKRGVVGRNRIHVHAFKGKQPHGAIQQLYATTVTVNGHRGRAIVKANHTAKGATVHSVYDQPNKFLSSYTVMFANKPGYDPENSNWFWVRYWKDGRITRTDTGTAVAGRVGKISPIGCIGCHRKVGGQDLEALTSR